MLRIYSDKFAPVSLGRTKESAPSESLVIDGGRSIGRHAVEDRTHDN